MTVTKFRFLLFITIVNLFFFIIFFSF
jgi:hypothetical protein